MTRAGQQSGREFERQVIQLAHLLGWRIASFRPALTKHGWRTAVQADGAGWPDLVLVHPQHGVLFRELKAGSGRLTADQIAWQTRLRDAGANVAVWRPHQLSTQILFELRGEAADLLQTPA